MSAPIAHLMSRFPKVSETFILNEIVGLQRLGLRVEVFPLIAEDEPVAHPEAAALARVAHVPPRGWRLVAPQLRWLRRDPGAYLGAWWAALKGNRRSRSFLVRAVAVVPAAAWFAEEMERLGVTRMHAHYATHPALAAFVVHRLTGIPYSITAHAHDIYVERAMLREKVLAADFLVTISEFNRDLLAKLYGRAVRNKTHVVRTGADLSVFTPRERPSGRGLFTAVCVASLQDYKGHPWLIDACAQLVADGVPVRCLCIGEGADRPALEARIREHGLEDAVLLLGAQPRARVAELLGDADVFVLPSIITASGKMEGVPVALMEALAMEVPVVATDISGIGELVEDGVTGELVPEKDSAALAEALRRVHDDPERAARLARAGRARVLADYDLERNVAQLHRLLAG